MVSKGWCVMVKSRLLWIVGIVALVGAVSGGPSAQTPPRPAFEVASIKRNVSLDGSGGMRVEPGGRFQVVNAPVFWLVASAYSESMGALRPSQIINAPGWLESEHHDIIAKAADPSDMSTVDKTRLLLRSLLEDRFQLRVHREQRQMAIYALVRARPDGVLGSRFRQSTADCLTESAKCGFVGGPVGQVKADSITMDILTQLLANAAGRIVADRTGLHGGFAIDLEWSPDQTASDKPSIFTAVQEQLGLKLEPTKGPVDVVVIDHVEHPTED
jgi:uncharacterized protein (TIGR03435 family)